MLTTHDILWGVVYPALLAPVVILLAHIARRGRRDTHPWGVPLALAGGFAIAFIGISGGFNLPPRLAQEWLVVAAASALVVSIIASIRLRTRTAAVALSIIVLLALAWLVIANRRPYLPTREFRTTIAIIAGGLVLWWAAMEPLAARLRGVMLPLLLSASAAAAAIVLVNAHTQRLGQIQGAAAAVLLIVALMAVWLRELSLASGGILTVAVIVLGLLICGYLYADVTWVEASIVAAAPLLAWVSMLPIVRSRARWLRLATTAVLVLAALAIAAVPAAKGLRQTMKEQTESYLAY